jgi:hypothetical protein
VRVEYAESDVQRAKIGGQIRSKRICLEEVMLARIAGM